MKRSIDFFRIPKQRPRVQCHVDGISIPGIGSMRLSNIPKNLWKMGNLLLTLGQKAHSVLFYGLVQYAVSVMGDCQDSEMVYSNNNLYLNYTQGYAFLWIKYSKYYDLIFPNNICNFSIAEKQRGDYVLNGCACSWVRVKGVTSYKASLFGQNLTPELINCIENQLQCNTSSFGKMMIAVIVIGIVIVLLSCSCFCGFFFCPFYCRLIDGEFNRREEEKILLNRVNLSDLKRQSSNPLLDEDPPVEPSSENNSWCCFRR